MGTKNHPGRFDVDFSKIGPDEPFFILRAKDSCAADTVENWAIRAKVAGRDNDMIREAYACAEEMRQWRSDNFDRYSTKEDDIHSGNNRPAESRGSK